MLGAGARAQKRGVASMPTLQTYSARLATSQQYAAEKGRGEDGRRHAMKRARKDDGRARHAFARAVRARTSGIAVSPASRRRDAKRRAFSSIYTHVTMRMKRHHYADEEAVSHIVK